MFYFTPPGPTEKTPLVFWVTATKCHLSVPRCHFRAVPLFPALNREFILHFFIFQPFWKTENSLKFIQFHLPATGRDPLSAQGAQKGRTPWGLLDLCFLAQENPAGIGLIPVEPTDQQVGMR